MDFITFVWLILGIGIIALGAWIYQEDKEYRDTEAYRQFHAYRRHHDRIHGRNKNKR